MSRRRRAPHNNPVGRPGCTGEIVSDGKRGLRCVECGWTDPTYRPGPTWDEGAA